MITVPVMANDVAVGLGGADGYLEINVYKALMIANIMQSIIILSDGCTSFRRYLVEGTRPNRKKITEYIERSLLSVTALSPGISYEKTSTIAQKALEEDLTLKEAALGSGYIQEKRFAEVTDPRKMIGRFVPGS